MQGCRWPFWPPFQNIDSTTPKHPTPTFFTQMIDVVPTGPTRKLEYFAGGFKRFNRNELQQLVIRRPTYTHSIKARTLFWTEFAALDLVWLGVWLASDEVATYD